MGFVLLGVATLTRIGVDGALFASVAHGLITGLLFFIAGGFKGTPRYHRPLLPRPRPLRPCTALRCVDRLCRNGIPRAPRPSRLLG